MKTILLCIVAVLTFADSRGEAPEPSKPPEATTTIDAKLDDKGRVIFMELEGRNVALRSGQDFGMMVYYNKYEANPRPR